jgi:cobalt-zinc-cadmium efflux system outer membrane protein
MRIASCLMAALIAAAGAPAGAQVLSFEESQRLALQNQPSLLALEHAARAAQNNAVADSALPDPRLKLGALNFPVQGFPSARDDMTQVGVTWEQAWPGGDKRRLRAERANAEAGQLQAEAHSQMQNIQRDAGIAWVEAWTATGSLRLAGDLESEFGRALELSRIPLASGRGSPADVLAARQALAQAIDRKLDLGQQAARARASLARWVPQAASRPLPAEPPRLDPPAPLEALRRALETHPQHQMQTLVQGVAEAEVALAREASKPDRTVEVGYYARSGDRTDMVMLQVAFELPIFSANKQDRQVESKLGLLERARELRADHLRELQAGLEATYEEWRLAGARLENTRSLAVPAARAKLEAVSAQHSAGGASLAAVLEARRGLVEARMQEQQLVGALAKTRVALSYYASEGVHQ